MDTESDVTEPLLRRDLERIQSDYLRREEFLERETNNMMDTAQRLAQNAEMFEKVKSVTQKSG